MRFASSENTVTVAINLRTSHRINSGLDTARGGDAVPANSPKRHGDPDVNRGPWDN